MRTSCPIVLLRFTHTKSPNSISAESTARSADLGGADPGAAGSIEIGNVCEGAGCDTEFALSRVKLADARISTFAAEVAAGLPSAVTLAAGDEALGQDLVAALGHPYFRPYQAGDVTGAQVGGAVKNVLAIAAGIVAGARLGSNAAAALITRGLRVDSC